LAEPLDLAQGAACRLRLLGLSPDRHLLIVFAHHAVWDGASAELFVTELMSLYEAFRRGEASPLPEPSFQYADFAAWQRAFYESAEGKAQIAWWTEKLVDARGPELPTRS